MKIIENKNNMIILENESEIYFISYQTTICKYNTKTKILQVNANYWDYSQTTLKQLKYFVNEYTLYIYETKQQFEKALKTNNFIEEIIGL